MTDSIEPTHYEILGVSEDASPAEIKAAHKKIMRDYHPDNFRDAEKEWVRAMADSRSKAANAANDVLKDPHKRAAYDRKLEEEHREREREEEYRQAWEEARRQEPEEEPAADPEDAWTAWEEARDAEEERAEKERSTWDEWEASQDAEDEAEDGWTEWEDGREEHAPDPPPPPPPPPARPPPSDLLGLATWTADRIPLPVHLLCGALVSGFGWTLAILLISQQSFAMGALLTLVFLASVPVAGGLLWLNGLSLSRVGMVVVAVGGGLPALLVASLIPGLNVLLFLGAVAWAVVMLAATYARRSATKR